MIHPGLHYIHTPPYLLSVELVIRKVMAVSLSWLVLV
jgi:hypothetical protein